MKITTVFLLLVVVLCVVLTPIAKTQSKTASADPMESFYFLVGSWHCDGKFTSSEKSISANLAFEPILDGKFFLFRHDDEPPALRNALLGVAAVTACLLIAVGGSVTVRHLSRAISALASPYITFRSTKITQTGPLTFEIGDAKCEFILSGCLPAYCSWGRALSCKHKTRHRTSPGNL